MGAKKRERGGGGERAGCLPPASPNTRDEDLERADTFLCSCAVAVHDLAVLKAIFCFCPPSGMFIPPKAGRGAWPALQSGTNGN